MSSQVRIFLASAIVGVLFILLCVATYAKADSPTRIILPMLAADSASPYGGISSAAPPTIDVSTASVIPFTPDDNINASTFFNFHPQCVSLWKWAGDRWLYRFPEWARDGIFRADELQTLDAETTYYALCPPADDTPRFYFGPFPSPDGIPHFSNDRRAATTYWRA